MSERIHIALEEIKIARPCRADWDAMSGDQRARFCGMCHKNVYDISRMSRVEAENLIREKEGRLCVRLYRRADGTVITSDCPGRRLGGAAAIQMAGGRLRGAHGGRGGRRRRAAWL